MKKSAKSIMIQGTMSNVGKSLIAAGLCRIYAERGLRVAPFKGQNMALNSYITSEGLEMGRAQVMQAECAGIAPDVRMNPVLLKPVSDMGSSVIVNGEVLGTMKAADYYRFKPNLIPKVREAYESLASENDLIVIEGAGSPAEINLKDADGFVNMGMAKIAKAPVLLVGDIDRGGVFAQLEGTVHLLDPDERAMVKGLIINKFRGDIHLLDSGVRMIEAITGIPVLGVTPYMQLDVDDEDSLTERFHAKNSSDDAAIDIAVIRLSRISNFTDFNAFDLVSGVSIRYCSSVRSLGNPDMILIPGSKNTMDDLQWMRDNGLEQAIRDKAEEGTVIFGVCGGYQMLGESISDPQGVEAGGTMRGMGLLPVKTVFAGQKTRLQVAGTVQNTGGILSSVSGQEIRGYEIHNGVTERAEDCQPFAVLHTESKSEANVFREEGAFDASDTIIEDGAQHGNVYGTYVHGIFDHADAAGRIARALAAKKGIDPSGISGTDYREYKESQYDILADTLKKYLDMDAIDRIIQNGI